MTTYTAANLQTMNDYAGLNNTTIELFMDMWISHINAETGASIPHFRDDGVNPAGSLEVDIADSEEPAFLAAAALALRAFNDKGPNVNVSAIGVSNVITDPHYSVYNKMFKLALNRLRGRSFVRV